MKSEKCAVCGGEGYVCIASDKFSGKTLYGVSCGNDHHVAAVFETKNRAVKAWNECQGFYARYSG